MTRDVTPDIAKIRLFLTEPHPCSYLDDTSATTAFVDPTTPIDNRLYTRLSELGFRRSGRYIYTPRCEGCNACIPARIPVATLNLTRRHKRCIKRNQDLTIQTTRTPDHTEHYQLYQRYISIRHNDGDMFPPTPEQYEDFIGSLWETSSFIEFRKDGCLVAAAVIDILGNGISAIYTYFSPDEQRRSLGTFAILTQVELAIEKQLPYVYLGYWIKENRKMSYKDQFRPLQLQVNGHWVLRP